MNVFGRIFDTPCLKNIILFVLNYFEEKEKESKTEKKIMKQNIETVG